MSRLVDSADAAEYASAVLTGSRLRFRGLVEDDLATLAVWQMNPRVLATLEDWVIPPSEPAIRAHFAEWSANQGSDIGFSIETTEDEPELIGHVGATGLHPQRRCATLSLLIGPEHAGHGYGGEAVRLIVDYLFREVGVHRVQASFAIFNPATRSICAGAGMREEGTRRQAIFHDGEWYDEVMMAILEDEWRASRRA